MRSVQAGIQKGFECGSSFKECIRRAVFWIPACSLRCPRFVTCAGMTTKKTEILFKSYYDSIQKKGLSIKMHPQFIVQKGQPIFAVLPYKEYKDILEKLEDIETIKLSQQDDSERFPFELLQAIANGKNSIKAYREYRELSQVELAKQVGVSKQYISQIETGERVGAAKILKKIAKILRVDLEDITA